MPRNQRAAAADVPRHPRPRFVPDPDRLLKLDLPPGSLLGRAVTGRTVGPIERALGLEGVNALYEQAVADPLPAGPAGIQAFCRRLLDGLGVRVSVAAEDLARVPKKGPVVVVANHPFGALDGMILSAVLMDVRLDLKVMANYLLGRVPELRELLVQVDPFGGPDAAARNAGRMRQGLRWLRDGHALAAFPAGEVAHLRLGNLAGDEGPVTDPAWNGTIARLVARAEVPVLPVFVDGCNGSLFQAAGLVHPRLRTALLARALLSKRGAAVTLRVGSVIPAKRIGQIGSEQGVTDYLRRRTFLLRHGVTRPSIPVAVPGAEAPAAVAAEGGPAVQRLNGDDRGSLFSKSVARAKVVASALRSLGQPPKPAVQPIVDPVDPALMAAEVAALPPGGVLLDHDDMLVAHAKASEIRHVLREIGRLREVTFRQVGEGTGKSLDLDTFDYDYRHLFIWNRSAREIVGAYRLGQTDLLLPAKGRQGLYTNTLFNYKAELLDRLNPALEMGRSFVRPEYQKSYAPLLLLWKGIGHFLVRHPQYRYLLGPVSISNSYQTVSRQLMVTFLKLHHAMPQGESLAQPKHPFRPKRGLRMRGVRLGLGRWDDDGVRRLLRDDDEVSTLIADLEPDQKGIPVLIRQYLKLGAKFLAFNVDRAFGDCLDGLIVVDLLHTEARVLERYMTKPGYASFVGHLRGTGTGPGTATASREVQTVSV